MTVPFLSLDGATATGPGNPRDLGEVADHHTMQVWTTGDPTNVRVDLEGSHDGVHWTMLVAAGVGLSTVPAGSSGALVRHVRANLISWSGGSSPTLTASIASGTGSEAS